MIDDFFPMKKPVCETTNYECPFLSQCDFIRENEAKMPELIHRIQSEYCTKALSRCARFRVRQALGPDALPPLLLPDQLDWARQIIEEYGRDPRTDEQTARA